MEVPIDNGTAMPAWTWILLILVVSALSFSVRLPIREYPPGLADERDYRLAAIERFDSIYFGYNTVSLFDLIRRYRSEPQFREHPWQVLADEQEQLAWRHFHVPLSFYPSVVLSGPGRPDWPHRILPVSASALVAPLIMAGCWWLNLSIWGALAASLLVAVDRRFIEASMILSPHPLYILLAVAFLFAFAGFLQKPTARRRLAVIALFALAVACLELSPLLAAAGLLAVALCHRTVNRAAIRPQWMDLVVFAALLFAIWPAGFLKLGYATCYGVFAVLGSVRADEYYGPADAQTLYSRLFGGGLLVGACAAAALIGALLAWARRVEPVLAVFASYAVLAVSFNLLNSFRNATYAAESTVFIWLLFVPAVDTLLKGRAGRALVAVALVGAVASAP